MPPHTRLLLIAGCSALALGLGAIYLAWRARADAVGWRRPVLAGGWALAALGGLAWAFAGSPDVALSQAVTLGMVLALLAIVLHSLTLSQRARRKEKAAAAAREAELGPGFGRRVAARLAGSLVLMPVLSVLAGLAWVARVPGDEATRLAVGALLIPTLGAVVLVVLLASARPVRVCLALTAGAAVLAVVAFLPSHGIA